MSAFRTLVGLGLASTMMITAPVFAANTTTTRTTTTAAAPAAKPVKKVAAVTPKAKITTPAKLTPAKATPARAVPAKAVAARSGANTAQATLSNGKKVTYNCNLAGNKNKQACKR